MPDDTRLFPDLLGSLSWNVVYKGTLVAASAGEGRYIPIPRKTYLIQSSRLVAIGCKNPQAPPFWYHACWMHAIIPQQLDSGQNLPALIYAAKGQARLGVYNLFSVSPWVPLPWILQLDVARWHQQLELEIYWYDGDDYSLFNPPP